MPEGHSVHRIGRQFKSNFVGQKAEVSSPQGRFEQGAAILDGQKMTDARAVGKQMFLEFENQDWLRVHLGIYGAWDFSGDVRVDPSIQIHAPRRVERSKASRAVSAEAASASVQSENGRLILGQTGEYSRPDGVAPVDRDGEDSVASIGAPRRTRVRMAEHDSGGEDQRAFPPEPVGQVRVRLLTETVCADLRGPTACEVLDPAGVDKVLQRLGPDPANANTRVERDRFIERASAKRTAIGLVLMDQSVLAGIGNVYRAELLFRAGIDPYTPANTIDRSVLELLWEDWAKLLDIGITVGQMITIDDLEGQDYDRALRERDERHWVYKLEGTPCKRCGTNISLEIMGNRKLYWCAGCQS